MALYSQRQLRHGWHNARQSAERCDPPNPHTARDTAVRKLCRQGLTIPMPENISRSMHSFFPAIPGIADRLLLAGKWFPPGFQVSARYFPLFGKIKSAQQSCARKTQAPLLRHKVHSPEKSVRKMSLRFYQSKNARHFRINMNFMSQGYVTTPVKRMQEKSVVSGMPLS